MAQSDPRLDWPGVGELTYSAVQIQDRVRQLAQQINRDYQTKELTLIGILKGATPFIADLLRELTIPAQMETIAISRFAPSEQSRGAVRLIQDLEAPLENRHALVVDVIADTGFTLSYLFRTLAARHPASLGICVLLNRPKRRLLDLPLNYVGFEAPDDFLIGYGMHVEEAYRQLPFIAQFEMNQRES